MFLMDDLKKWKAVYRLLDMVQTEVFDCGTLCGNACCLSGWEESDMGIFLLPGEHLLLKEADPEGKCFEWEALSPEEVEFPKSWDEPVYFVRCVNPPHCRRDIRPVQCRTFPLKPVIGESGVLEMIWNDDELPYVCPLIEGNFPIHDSFYKATYTVWSHLIRDKRIFDLVSVWS